MKLCIRVLLIILVWAGAASGQTKPGVQDLSHWQGEFISRNMLMNHPDMEPLYRQIAEAAEKIGKSYTAGSVKERLTRLSHTDFDRIVVNGDTISFYSDDPRQSILKTFTYAGEKSDAYGKTTFNWYGFTSDRGPSEEKNAFSFLLLLKIHSHEGGTPHFHIRYSDKGFEALTGPEFNDWWPTMLPAGMEMKDFLSDMDPDRIARLIL